MAKTYEPIATYTIPSATTSYTFSSIPSTYTDIVAILSGTISASAPATSLRFNGDTATNYSYTYLTGDGTSASSSRASSQTSMGLTYNGAISSSPNTNIIHIQNYTNTTTFKTVLSRASQAQYGTDAIVGLWRKTPEAITSITFITGGTGFAAGSTFTLYGIKAA
jgi:hypothetical protein